MTAQPLDGLYGAGGTMPSEEFELLILERVRGAEELLQLLARPRGKVLDVLQVGLARGAIRHCEDAIISFLFTLRILLDLENPNGFALKNYAGIGLGFVNDQNVERIAVLRFGRRNESPIIGVGKAGHERLGKREHAQSWIKIQLAGATARGFDDGVDAALVGPCWNLSVG